MTRKVKQKKVLVSLPITRTEIVIAKYIASSLFIMAGLSVTFIVVILGNIFIEQRYSYAWVCNIFSNSSNFDLLCSNDTD